MTEEKIKSLEERVKQIRTLMDSANKTYRGQLAIYHQTFAISEQNNIIIDYLQEIYKEIKK